MNHGVVEDSSEYHSKVVLGILRDGGSGHLAELAEQAGCRVVHVETCETPERDGGGERSDLWHVWIGGRTLPTGRRVMLSVVRTVSTRCGHPLDVSAEATVAHGEHFPSVEAVRWATHEWDGLFERLGPTSR